MPSKPTTFVQIADDLVKDAEVRVKLGQNAPSLIRDYKQRLGCYCRPFFEAQKVKDIDARRLREFRDWLAAKGLKNSTILPIMSFVRKALQMAHDDGLISQVPRMPVQGQKPSPRPAFNREQYRYLLKTLKRIEAGKPVVEFKGTVVDWELRAMVTFMVNSFLRPGDLFTLQNKHVTVVPESNEGPAYLRLEPPASKGHDYPVIAMPVAADIYRRTVAAHSKGGFGKPDDFVFMPSRQKRAYAHEIVRRQFGLVLKEAGLATSAKGIPHTLYSLRHTAITFRLLNGDDIDLLTLARTCRTSVEMIDRFYASSLSAEMNRDKLFGFRRPTRYAA